MLQPPLDPLTRRSFPELATALRARSVHVMERWTAAARDVLPSADELTFNQLRDSFPRVLTLLADTLASDHASSADRMIASSTAHGQVRFHQSYDINHVLIEYGLLRRFIIEEILEHLHRPLSAEEAVGLNLGVDTAAREAVIAFSAHQTRQLQAATEAQSKYLSFLSHDLRGGLNGIFLMIEVLKRELVKYPELGETMDDLDSMRRSMLETVGTMDRFLHAERFRKGKVQVRPMPVRLDTLLSDISAQFAYQARDKGVELKVDVPAQTRMISDRDLLSMIFQNLVSNAVKYTAKGTVQIGARRADATDGADGTWRVEVIDQGPGIAPDKLSDLFDSFTRGDTHGQPGVGLGLSIAQQAARLLGAKLWAESSPGQGSVFYVDLPEKVEATPEPASATA